VTQGSILLLFAAYVAVFSTAYGVTGTGAWAVGRWRSRPRLRQTGYSLALASGCVLLGYAVTLYLFLTEVGGWIGGFVAEGVVFSTLLLLPVPLVVAVVLYVVDGIRGSILRSVLVSFSALVLVGMAVWHNPLL